MLLKILHFIIYLFFTGHERTRYTEMKLPTFLYFWVWNQSS
jgi:hypothetical protein